MPPSKSEPSLGTARSLPWIQRLRSELKEQGKTALPTLAGMLLYKMPWLISLRFVGEIGAEELAAAALATTLCNVTGLSLSVGLSSALTTLAGQARGDLQVRQELAEHRTVHFENGIKSESSFLLESGGKANSYHSTSTVDSREPLLPLVFLYRGLFIQHLFVLPIGIWWISGIKPVLLALGQGEQLSTMTEQYLRILAPGLWSYSVNWTLTAWLQAIEMADVPAFAAAVGLIMHVPMNYFFIYELGWGYLGCGVATVVFQLVQPVLMLTYLFGTAAGRSRALENMAAIAIDRTHLSFWPEARIAVGRGYRQYLGLALPGVVIISEWWASEMAIFLSGRLTPSPELALGAMTLYQSINTFCFMFPVSCGVAGSTRVSNLLGAGNTREADWSAKVNVALAGTVSAVLGCILYFTPHGFFPSLFAPDEPELILEASRLIPLLAAYVFADGVQSAFNGIIKGCGRQVIVMPIVIFAYWIVAIPLAYYLAFVRHGGIMCEDSYFCGDVGLVMGMTTGTWVHMLLLGVVVIGTTNWDTEAKKAKQRVNAYDEQHERRKSEDTITTMDILSM